MKRFPYFASLLLALVALHGCKTRDTLNTNISSVTTYFAPVDNAFVKLQPTTSASVSFEWEQARAEDGTLVLYEVAFDRANGDFTSPVFKLVSDNGGVLNRLTLSHKDLNRIASLSGIQSLGIGNLKWTVLASKGINVQKSPTVRTIRLERPAGFTDLPSNLYLTGAASEGGTDVTKAVPFKQTANGVFEAFTQLKPGAFRLVDRLDNNAKSYVFNGQAISLGTDGASPVTTGAKTYRIVLDFNNAAATVTELSKVELWLSVRNDVIGALAYQGNGVWSTLNFPMVLDPAPWNTREKEERYKFRFTFVGADGKTTTQFYASSIGDNQRSTPTTPAPYFYLLPQPLDQNQWDNSYKFPFAVDGRNLDITVTMQAAGPYTHAFVIKQ